MKQAIIGAGSLGTILGAILSSKGMDIDLVDVWEEHVNVLNSEGATITGQMSLKVAVNALLPRQVHDEYDIIYYMVKSPDDESALPLVRKHLKPDGFVVSMQNGFPEEKISKYVGPERLLGCPIGWGAELLGPGLSRLAVPPEHMTFYAGEPYGAPSARLSMLAGILGQAGTVHISNNLAGHRWAKLVNNSSFTAISTVMGAALGEVTDDPKGLLCAALIMNEALTVAEAAGIKIEPIQGADISIFHFESKADYEKLEPILKMMVAPHRSVRASMLQDLEKGKRCEIDAINGIIVEWGTRYSVPVPVNQQVVSVIKDIESGRLSPGSNHLDMITVPGWD